jgi:long-chain acyl-CoA synthetase
MMAGRTILDLYRNELAKPRPDHYAHQALTGVRKISTQDFFATTSALADGLAAFGVGKGDRVLLLSDNRPEWHQVDIAALSLGAVSVPVYPTLPPDGVAYHVQDSGSKVAFSENQMQTRKLLEHKNDCPDLQFIIQLEGGCPEGVLEFEDVVSSNRSNDAEQRFWDRAAGVADEDLASIVYTSGTTGRPKGVMLSHRNFVSNVEAVLPRVPLTDSDRALEFLPLCHVFERTCGYAYMERGLSRTYCAPGVVADHIKEIAPTVFASVPRLYEKIHSKIMTKVESAPPLRKKLFGWAVEVGRQASVHRLEGTAMPLLTKVKHKVADGLVLSKIRAAFGGRVRMALSGGAPLAADLNAFFHAIGVPIQEGYGLTETSPGIGVAGCQPGENRLGSVGKVLHNIEVKFAEDGELLVRGPSITKGYWNKPQETAEVFDAEGFFRTGDIAYLDDDGFLFITDRKKDLIIPAGGKNVAPQPIENALKSALFIDNAVLIGDKRPFIVALISPSEDEILAWAASNGLGGHELAELLDEAEIKKSFKQAVADVNSTLGHFEQVKKFRVLPRPLSLEQGYLTPTLKVKRNAVEADFKDLIDEMYQGK